MVVDSKLANSFIHEYITFLLFAYQACHENDENEEYLYMLALGRDAYDNDRGLIDEFLEKKKIKQQWIIEAIMSLDLDHWIYLRDTTKYSLFIRADESDSYAVLGLTDPIRDVFGCSGLFLKTGLVHMGSNYVCDGLISNPIVLGRNYRDQFNAVYKDLKANGKFFKQVVSG